MVIIEKWQLVTSYFVAARGGGGELVPCVTTLVPFFLNLHLFVNILNSKWILVYYFLD
ncbi:MAG: hypothetical protein ACI90V_010653 [Bacillariaceae sp.]|jgi:hypothetical protein